MASRNFPPSFYHPQAVSRYPIGLGTSLSSQNTTDLYEAYHGSIHSIQSSHGADPWAYSISPQAYAHRSVGHDVYHPAMTSSAHPYQYSAFGFQQPFSRLPGMHVPSQMNKCDTWGSRYYEAFTASGAAEHLSNGLDTSYSSHYHNMAAGLEGPNMPQEYTKDFYWSL